MKKLAIFDLDGTLLDTLQDLAAACNHALSAHDLPQHPVECYKQFVGNGVYKLIERIVPAPLKTDAALRDSLKSAFDSYYESHADVFTTPYEGIKPMLDELRAQGLRLAVLSNKPHAFTQRLCEHFFPGYFSPVFGNRVGYPHKPDRVLVDEVLQITGIVPQDCIYIGDSDVDMCTAKNAGVFGIGVLWGFRSKQELLEAGADAVVEAPREIVGYIGRKF